MSNPRYIQNVHCYYSEVIDSDTGERRKVQVVDAIKPLEYWIENRHVWGASSKWKQGTVKCTAPTKCVQMNSIGCLPWVYLNNVDKTTARVIFKNNIWVARRYDLEEDGMKIGRINDKEGKMGLIRALRNGPIKLRLLVPRWNHSLEYLQSEEKAEINKETARRRREKDLAGLAPNPYDSPVRKGYRSGSSAWHKRPTRG